MSLSVSGDTRRRRVLSVNNRDESQLEKMQNSLDNLQCEWRCFVLI